jgi:hypothetical protein
MKKYPPMKVCRCLRCKWNAILQFYSIFKKDFESCPMICCACCTYVPTYLPTVFAGSKQSLALQWNRNLQGTSSWRRNNFYVSSIVRMWRLFHRKKMSWILIGWRRQESHWGQPIGHQPNHLPNTGLPTFFEPIIPDRQKKYQNGTSNYQIFEKVPKSPD